MTVIIATPDTATGSVRLDITQTSSVTRVTRSNVNGIADVRVAASQLPTPATGTTIITDYEAAHGSNTYNAYVTDTATRTNLSPNPSSEVATPFVNLSNCSAARDSASPYVGTWHTRLTVTTTASAWATTATGTSGFPVVAGKTYHVSAYLKRNGTTDRTGDVRLVFYTSAGAFISTLGTAGNFTFTSTYARATNTAVAPATAAYAALYVGLATGVVAGETFDVDALFTEEGSLGAYFDGSTPDVTDVDYAWTGTAHASTSTETTTTRQVTASATLTVDKPWLLVPIAPNYSAQMESILNYSAARETNSTVHTIIGRADPLVVLGKLGLRSGQLEIWTANLEAAATLARVFDRGEAVFLKQTVPGMDMYFMAESLDVEPYQVAADLTRYRFNIRYREVTRPYGNLAGALGWSFSELAATYSSFDAVSAAFATFDDLTIGDTL